VTDIELSRSGASYRWPMVLRPVGKSLLRTRSESKVQRGWHWCYRLIPQRRYRLRRWLVRRIQIGFRVLWHPNGPRRMVWSGSVRAVMYWTAARASCQVENNTVAQGVEKLVSGRLVPQKWVQLHWPFIRYRPCVRYTRMGWFVRWNGPNS
jgi:hypothetical protein